jgi:hypothetical protein
LFVQFFQKGGYSTPDPPPPLPVYILFSYLQSVACTCCSQVEYWYGVDDEP